MKIHDYQAKEVLRQHGIPVPRGYVAFNAQEALEAAMKLGRGPWVLKPQSHSRRPLDRQGRTAFSLHEVLQLSAQMLASSANARRTISQQKRVRRLLVEEVIEPQQAFALAVKCDRELQMLSISASMHLEAFNSNSKSEPSGLPQVVHVDPTCPRREPELWALTARVGVPSHQAQAFVEVANRLLDCYMCTDATLAEIDPLVVLSSGRFVAVGARLEFDPSALYRQPCITSHRDLDEEDDAEFDAELRGFKYVNLHGDIGCIANGAGLAMATADAIRENGGRPANLLDVGGEASEGKVVEALVYLQRLPALRALIVNIFSGTSQCDVIADEMINALASAGLAIPVVVRLKGVNEERARGIVLEYGHPFIAASTIEGAARTAVEVAGMLDASSTAS